MKHKLLVIAFAEGKSVYCKYKGWTDWFPISEMRGEALRVFLGLEEDENWEFKDGGEAEKMIREMFDIR